MTTWNLVHPHDFFIAGIVVGILVNCWVFTLVLLFREMRPGRKERRERTPLGNDQNYCPSWTGEGVCSGCFLCSWR